MTGRQEGGRACDGEIEEGMMRERIGKDRWPG